MMITKIKVQTVFMFWGLCMPVTLKDVRGWQFLTMKAAETLCIVCLPPEKHIS